MVGVATRECRPATTRASSRRSGASTRPQLSCSSEYVIQILVWAGSDGLTTRPSAQGEYMKALECMERGLVLRQHFFGADSDEVWQAAKVVGEMCNLLAMTYLQQGSLSGAAVARHVGRPARDLRRPQRTSRW